MPDWREIVSKGLSGLKLGAGEKEEVHAELAAHLEESYEVFCKEGLPEKEAVHRTFEQVADWQGLRREIFIAKRSGHPMQKRVQQLWTPGFLTMALTMISLVTLQGLGFQARVVSWNGPRTTFLNLPWLLSLPFFGALGAYLSSRAGGSRRAVLLASTFPALALTGAFLSMFPIGFAMERIIGRRVGFSIVATTILRDGIGWLLVPGAALLAGGVPAQLFFYACSIAAHTALGVREGLRPTFAKQLRDKPPRSRSEAPEQ